MTLIRAVAPYHHPGRLNFKEPCYEAWVEAGGRVAAAHHPPHCLKGLAHRYEWPWHMGRRREARLRFVEPVTLCFDTFPDYALHEVVPFIWDCWDCHFEKTVSFFKRHGVRTAIFTASQSAERMRSRMPGMNILHMPEAVDTRKYLPGRPLAERSIDLLEYGRPTGIKVQLTAGRHHVSPADGRLLFGSQPELASALADSRVVIALPRSVTQPALAASVETLTQRYWECMLSGAVMVGKAPRELVELIGYDPIIALDMHDPSAQIENILLNITDYQELAGRNRSAALEHGSWLLRMRRLMQQLQALGYNCINN